MIYSLHTEKPSLQDCVGDLFYVMKPLVLAVSCYEDYKKDINSDKTYLSNKSPGPFLCVGYDTGTSTISLLKKETIHRVVVYLIEPEFRYKANILCAECHDEIMRKQQ